MRALITGITGFVGHYLARELRFRGHEVSGVGFWRRTPKDRTIEYREVDIQDASAVLRAFKDLKPDVVFHLAAQANIGHAISNPASR